MSNLYVRNGTPIGAVSKCSTCANAHVVEGYRESEVIVMCTYASYTHALMIPFRVKSCSNYEDRTKPSWLQMQKLAIPVSDAVRKPAGFLGERAVSKEVDDDE